LSLSLHKSKTVCIFTSVHSPFDTRIFYKEAKSLLKAGYEVILIAQHYKDEIVEGIKIISLKKPRNRIERMTKTVWQVYRKALKADADIYHFHDPELMLIGLLLKLRGKRMIYDVHEDVTKQNLSKAYLPVAFRKPISVLIAAIESFSSRRFDGIVTATPFINKRFLDLNANVVNVNNFPIVSELRPEKNQWETKEKAVCYVGLIARIRGALEMMDTIEKTKYRLLLAGDFEAGLEEGMMRMPGRPQVELLGFVDRTGVRAVMARSMAGLVLLHPVINYCEAFPIKMFEYMSAGIPVIASDFPLWKEIVEVPDCGVCVDPLNTKEIASVISWIIEHPIEAKRMGDNGRQAVKTLYNWRLEEKKLMRIYEKVMQ
jgi:glycosyltransferase involved in cell wall biosynthesis